MQTRITIDELAKITGFNRFTIQTWLSRSEFTKFYHRDAYFGKVKQSFAYNKSFKRTFERFLKRKGIKFVFSK